MLRGMAGTAIHPHVLAIKHVSSLGVIESLRSRIPVHHLEVHAVVVRVAFHAGLPWRAIAWEGRVQPPIAVNLLRNFTMALKTLERWSLGRDLVTLDAVRIPVQALVRSRQWSGRDLSLGNKTD